MLDVMHAAHGNLMKCRTRTFPFWEQCLFLQHFIKTLKAGGRAGVVIKNTFLSNTDNASTSLRKHLIETCNLHSILDMPGGTFLV